jgi:DNA-directed RNA polymerase subunit RPC12/RpoP
MSDQQLRCAICQSMVDEEDLFCANCGAEVPPPAGGLARTAPGARLATYNFECTGCGASMSYDTRAGGLRCPFCASEQLVAKPDAKILAPERVVPFNTSHEQALVAMRGWLGRGFFRPGDLVAQAAVVRMQPVYVPYWVFAAETQTHWTADSSQTPAGARASWYPLAGEHQGQYENLLIGASGALTPGETHALCPFDLAAGVAPEQVDLDNVTVEQFSVPRKYARPLARSGIESLEAQACAARYVPGSARNVHVNVRITALTSTPVLLPMWIMAYRYRERVFRLLVNGQTGKVTGQAPRSWWKLLLIPAAALAVLLTALMCAGLLGR